MSEHEPPNQTFRSELVHLLYSVKTTSLLEIADEVELLHKKWRGDETVEQFLRKRTSKL